MPRADGSFVGTGWSRAYSEAAYWANREAVPSEDAPEVLKPGESDSSRWAEEHYPLTSRQARPDPPS